jgi:rare lipoprotein A
MPLRQTIGISLAFLLMSGAAMAKVAEKGSAPHHSPPHAKTAKAHPHPMRRHWAARRRVRHRAVLVAADRDDGASRPSGKVQIGKAAWYELDGRRTASGDRFDGTAETAAHRSLPLYSYAKVTNLANGRSVVVEINDRGPWNRGLIIDLSEHAAEMIEMKRAGVARVAVEPLGAAPPAKLAANPGFR